MSESVDVNPLVSFLFSLEIEGKATGFFTEVSGLGSEHEIIENKLTDENGKPFIQKIPGRLKWQDLTLKRGVTENMDIWDWRKEVEDGDISDARTNGSVVLFDQEGGEVARWNFERAWPVKVTGPQIKADSNEIAIEELVLTYEFIERVT